MKLYIIRHGQTDWNIAKKIQGRQDIPLNERGHFQAQCLGKAMENRPITAVFSSPQIRAMETAIAVASPAGVPVIPVRGSDGDQLRSLGRKDRGRTFKR